MMLNAQRCVMIIAALNAFVCRAAHAEQDHDTIFTYGKEYTEEGFLTPSGLRVWYKTGISAKVNKKRVKDENGRWVMAYGYAKAVGVHITIFVGENAVIGFVNEKGAHQYARARIQNIKDGVAMCKVTGGSEKGEIVPAVRVYRQECQNVYHHDISEIEVGDKCEIKHKGEWKRGMFKGRKGSSYLFQVKIVIETVKTRGVFSFIGIGEKYTEKQKCKHVVSVENEEDIKVFKQCSNIGRVSNHKKNPTKYHTKFEENRTVNYYCPKCFFCKCGPERFTNQYGKTMIITKNGETNSDVNSTQKGNKMARTVQRLVQANNAFKCAGDTHRELNMKKAEAKPSIVHQKSYKAVTRRSVKRSAKASLDSSSESDDGTSTGNGSESQSYSDSGPRLLPDSVADDSSELADNVTSL